MTKGFRSSGSDSVPGHSSFGHRTFSRHSVFVIRHSTARFMMLAALLLGSRALLAIPAVPTTRERPAASPKIVRYAERLLARYDTNQNDHLSRDEWSKMRGRPDILDRDRDGRLSPEEIAGASQALLELDRNEDGELGHDELHPFPPPMGRGCFRCLKKR